MKNSFPNGCNPLNLAAAVALALAFASCADGDRHGLVDAGVDGDANGSAVNGAGVEELADGIKRVTLTKSGIGLGQGWNLEGARIARDSDDADFALSVAMVIALFPMKAEVAFCKPMPPSGTRAFARVQDVPSDLDNCTRWDTGYLGGNSDTLAEFIAGQGFLVKDRDAVPVAKLMTVSGSIVKADVRVTFDIVKL